MSQYFTQETDKYICLFNMADTDSEKHNIFNANIKPAFEKLIENLIFVYSYYAIDDVDTLKRECLSTLYEMLPKYNPEFGSKGFSYFNVVAKNWFIHRIREKNKRNKIESELYCDVDNDIAKNDPTFSISPYEDKIEDKEKWMNLVNVMESWKDVLKKDTELKVLEAVIFLLKNPDITSNYPMSKKAIYLYLREMTHLNTKQVVMNLKKIKGLYDSWCQKFNQDGGSFLNEV